MPEIGKPEQSCESDSPHSAHESPFLRIEAVRPDPFVASEMQLFKPHFVVSFLKNGDVIDSAFVQIFVFIDIERINFDTHHSEIFSC